VLAKRLKIEDRSGKRLGLDLVAKDLKIPGGLFGRAASSTLRSAGRGRGGRGSGGGAGDPRTQGLT
jgi:hypothetical protein